MKLHEALEVYLGMSKYAVVVLYRAVALVGFSAGLSLVVVALFVPDADVGAVRYLASDAVLTLADDLRVSNRFLVLLYGFIVSAVAVASYLFTRASSPP